jgi:hypothetical protein
MKTYIFLDLDDTLFQTLPKCRDRDRLIPAAYARDGAPLSFMTAQQQRFLDHCAACGTIIPTTARSLSAFQRVKLPFCSLAILDFGGVVLLPDGSLDAEWDAWVRPQAEAMRDSLEQVRRRVAGFCEARRLDVNARVVADFEMPLYLVAKHAQGNCEALNEILAEELLPQDDNWFIHLNDNNLSLVPSFLGKERAVQYVLDKHLEQPALTVGIGDSASDGGYLGLCDFAVLPRGSQAFRLLTSLLSSNSSSLGVYRSPL